jgi:hypothetical protein
MQRSAAQPRPSHIVFDLPVCSAVQQRANCCYCVKPRRGNEREKAVLHARPCYARTTNRHAAAAAQATATHAMVFSTAGITLYDNSANTHTNTNTKYTCAHVQHRARCSRPLPEAEHAPPPSHRQTRRALESSAHPASQKPSPRKRVPRRFKITTRRSRRYPSLGTAGQHGARRTHMADSILVRTRSKQQAHCRCVTMHCGARKCGATILTRTR